MTISSHVTVCRYRPGSFLAYGARPLGRGRVYTPTGRPCRRVPNTVRAAVNRIVNDIWAFEQNFSRAAAAATLATECGSKD